MILFCAFTITMVSCKKEKIITNPINVSPPINSILTVNGQPMFSDLNGWPCYRVAIPAGYHVDSVFCDFQRPGYPTSDLDLYMYYSVGQVFNSDNAFECSPDYQATTSSMYGVWIKMNVYKLNEQGVLQISAPPTSFGTVFTSVSIAVHKISG